MESISGDDDDCFVTPQQNTTGVSYCVRVQPLKLDLPQCQPTQPLSNMLLHVQYTRKTHLDVSQRNQTSATKFYVYFYFVVLCQSLWQLKSVRNIF